MLAWSDDDLSDWAPVSMTLAASAFTDTETGLLGVAARETVANDNHYIFKAIPVIAGASYRLRFLVRPTLRNTITINLPGKYWIGFIGSTSPDLASGISNMAVATVGSFSALSVDFTHDGATGDIGLSIGTALPGPTVSFPGDVTKGFEFGNAKLYRMG